MFALIQVVMGLCVLLTRFAIRSKKVKIHISPTGASNHVIIHHRNNSLPGYLPVPHWEFAQSLKIEEIDCFY